MRRIRSFLDSTVGLKLFKKGFLRFESLSCIVSNEVSAKLFFIEIPPKPIIISLFNITIFIITKLLKIDALFYKYLLSL